MDEAHPGRRRAASSDAASVALAAGSQCRCCSSSCSRTRPTAARWRASTRRCASPSAGAWRGAASADRGWRWARRNRVSGSRPPTCKTFGDEPFYDVKVLRTIFIQFPAANWEALLEPNYRRDVDVPATVTIDGKTYRDVGVRFRGNSSYRMVPSGFKRSLNLSLDAVHADQDVGGYNTLNLLNANRDPTFVRDDPLLRDRAPYLPAPKVNFVRVVINGESWGVSSTSSSSTRTSCANPSAPTKGVALEGARQPERPRRARVPRRRRRRRIAASTS